MGSVVSTVNTKIQHVYKIAKHFCIAVQFLTHNKIPPRISPLEAWGRGTIKIIKECKSAGLPEPIFNYNSSDISIEFRKDIYNEKYLNSLGLNVRQVKSVLFLKNKGKITNSEYQTLNNVSKATATRDLKELTETYKILKRTGDIGAGTNYSLIGSELAQLAQTIKRSWHLFFLI